MTSASLIAVRPIRSAADHAVALDEIAGLMDAAPGTPEADRLDVLATLVEAYEARHFPIDPPDPIEAIRFRMEQQGLTPKDLEPFIGTSARVSEVLNRRRSLSITMIRRLAEGLGIPAEVLIRPTGALSTRGTRVAGGGTRGRTGGEKRSTKGGATKKTTKAKVTPLPKGSGKGVAPRFAGRRPAR